MPEKYGGAGADILYAAVNWEEQSYCGFTGPGWALHSEIVMPYILHYGSGNITIFLCCNFIQRNRNRNISQSYAVVR